MQAVHVPATILDPGISGLNLHDTTMWLSQQGFGHVHGVMKGEPVLSLSSGTLSQSSPGWLPHGGDYGSPTNETD
jgi:hypothetical protein